MRRLVLALPLFLAAPLAAQGAYCIPGVAGACFTMNISIAPASATQSLVTFTLQNLQGTISSDPTPFRLNQFYLSRPRTVVNGVATDRLDYTLQSQGPTGVVGIAPPPTTFFQQNGSTPFFDVDQEVAGVGIVGCNGSSGVAQTCPAQGFTGGYSFSYLLSVVNLQTNQARQVTPSDFTWFVATLTPGRIIGCGGSGSTTDCAVVPYVTVTPEPRSLALVSAPLLLLAFLRRRA